MQVMFFKAIRPPKPPAPDAAGAPPEDDGTPDKPVHEHLRELADMVEQRDAKPAADVPGGDDALDAPGGDQPAGDGLDAPGGDEGQDAPGGDDPDAAPVDEMMGDQPGGDAGQADPAADPNADPDAAVDPGADPQQEEGASEYNAESVPVGSHVAFAAGAFMGSGEVTAVGEDGCTTKDKSGREHRIRWDEITGLQGAGAPPADDAGDGADPAAAPPGGPPGAPPGGKKPPFGGKQ